VDVAENGDVKTSAHRPVQRAGLPAGRMTLKVVPFFGSL
jgi:hypothetical protein